MVLSTVGPEADRITKCVLRQRAVHRGSGQEADDPQDDQSHLRQFSVGVRNAQLRATSVGSGQDATEAGGHRTGRGSATEPVHGGRTDQEH